jgi:hypothetical protein
VFIISAQIVCPLAFGNSVFSFRLHSSSFRTEHIAGTKQIPMDRDFKNTKWSKTPQEHFGEVDTNISLKAL